MRVSQLSRLKLKGIVTSPSLGGGSANAGFAVVDFGDFPGALNAEAMVTGQAGIVAGSVVQAWIRPVTTPDHLAGEHLVDPPRVMAGDIAPGVGFSIHCLSTNTRRHHGKYAVAWTWS